MLHSYLNARYLGEGILGWVTTSGGLLWRRIIRFLVIEAYHFQLESDTFCPIARESAENLGEGSLRATISIHVQPYHTCLEQHT